MIWNLGGTLQVQWKRVNFYPGFIQVVTSLSADLLHQCWFKREKVATAFRRIMSWDFFFCSSVHFFWHGDNHGFVIWNAEKCSYQQCYIGSTFTPKLQGKFLATENFFYTSKVLLQNTLPIVALFKYHTNCAQSAY